jgi:hypothetical protein
MALMRTAEGKMRRSEAWDGTPSHYRAHARAARIRVTPAATPNTELNPNFNATQLRQYGSN